MTKELEALVEAVLSADGDFDTAWARISTAIAAAPGEAGLRRLRMRLAEASGMRVAQIKDLRVLCELAPQDRQLALNCALLEHRWAWQLAQEEASLDDSDAHDDTSAEDMQTWIESDAIRRLAALVNRHCHDAEFMVGLLAQWDEQIGSLPPWVRLRCTLQALAANVQDRRLQRDLALQWVSLSGFAPSVDLPEDRQPMGFAIDVYGNLQDALASGRALQHIDALLAEDPEDAELWQAKGRMHLGVSQFEAAAAASQRAADLWARETGDADQSDALSSDRADEARELARRCAAGRAALASAWMQDLQLATARLGDVLPARPDASEAAQAFLADLQTSSLQAQSELESVLETQGAQMLAAAQAPDEEALAAMDALAQRLAGSVLGAVALAPAQWRPIDSSTQDLDPRLRAPESEYTALSLTPIGCLEHLDFSRQLGTLAAFRVWNDQAGGCLVSHAVAGSIDIVDIETEFSDGHQIITSASRGRNFMAGGPDVDGWHVDTNVPFADLLALHRARVALRLAQQPAVSVRAVQSLDDFIALQERQRRLKTHWRLQEGLSEFEALGVPVDKPEFFVPRFRRAVQATLQQAHDAIQQMQRP